MKLIAIVCENSRVEPAVNLDALSPRDRHADYLRCVAVRHALNRIVARRRRGESEFNGAVIARGNIHGETGPGNALVTL